ncbi:MAG: hypothetical protein AB8G99_24660 [Planctomycetaceae bacterium]
MTMSQFIQTAGTTFFGVEFVKVDGSVRRMVCQFRNFHKGKVCVTEPGQGYKSFYPGRILRIRIRGNTVECPSAKRFLNHRFRNHYKPLST